MIPWNWLPVDIMIGAFIRFILMGLCCAVGPGWMMI